MCIYISTQQCITNLCFHIEYSHKEDYFGWKRKNIWDLNKKGSRKAIKRNIPNCYYFGEHPHLETIPDRIWPFQKLVSADILRHSYIRAQRIETSIPNQYAWMSEIIPRSVPHSRIFLFVGAYQFWNQHWLSYPTYFCLLNKVFIFPILHGRDSIISWEFPV